VQRLLPGLHRLRRPLLPGRHRNHADRLAADLRRGHQVDGLAADGQPGGSRLAHKRAAALGHLDLPHAEGFRLAHVRPKALPLAARQPHEAPVRLAGPHQQRRARFLRPRRQLPEVALPVAHRHHPCARAGGRKLIRAVQPLDPADAVLFLALAEARVYRAEDTRNRNHEIVSSGMAPEIASMYGWPQPGFS